jgi:hypothetical protein
MDMIDYFSSTSGKGVLATADDTGRVDAAIYSRPHFTEEKEVVFIMRDRLTHRNLQSNPYATYLFIEDNNHYRGVRLFLKKLREDTDPERISQMTRRHLTPEEDEAKGPKFLVYFKVEKILSLVGDRVLDS